MRPLRAKALLVRLEPAVLMYISIDLISSPGAASLIGDINVMNDEYQIADTPLHVLRSIVSLEAWCKHNVVIF